MVTRGCVTSWYYRSDYQTAFARRTAFVTAKNRSTLKVLSWQHYTGESTTRASTVNLYVCVSKTFVKQTCL